MSPSMGTRGGSPEVMCASEAPDLWAKVSSSVIFMRVSGPSTCLGFTRLGRALFPLPSEVRDNTQHPLDQHDLAAVVHLVLFHR